LVSDFVESMADAGVPKLVLLSECAAQTRTVEVAERAVELAIQSSEIAWTILRPSWYMQDLINESFFGPMIRDEGQLVMTTGGERIAWIDARDVGRVAASVLLGSDAACEALELTGPEALTLDEVALRITRVAGSRVVGVEEPGYAAVDRMRRHGMADDEIAYLSRISDSICAGMTSTVTDAVRQFTGSDAISLDAFLIEHEALVRSSVQLDVAGSSSESPEDVRYNEALFRRVISCWATNDLDGLLECFTEDLEYTDMPFPDQSVRGKAAFRQHLEAYNSMFLDGQVEVDFVQVVANSTNVIGELVCRAVYVGPDAPPGGVVVRWCATISDTVLGGKVAYERAYYDPAAFGNAVAAAAL
jgi:ketosteroid isomerase-like protein